MPIDLTLIGYTKASCKRLTSFALPAESKVHAARRITCVNAIFAMVRDLIFCCRIRCSASAACWVSVVTATDLPGICAVVQMSSASVSSNT